MIIIGRTFVNEENMFPENLKAKGWRFHWDIHLDSVDLWIGEACMGIQKVDVDARELC
jgi:hypothetical protein